MQSRLPRILLAAAWSAMTLPALAAPGEPPAASVPGSPPVTEAPPPPPAAQQKLDKSAAIALLGRDVKGPSDIVVGQLVNVLVDPRGRPVGAVLDYGGFLGVGKRRIAVAWRSLTFRPEGIQLRLSREQLRAIPDFKDGEAATLAAPPAVGVVLPTEETPEQE